MTAILAKSTGRELVYEVQPMEEVSAMSEDLALMYKWFDRIGYTAGIAELRQDFPEVGWT